MNYDEIIAALTKFDYKPGYEIEVQSSGTGWVMLGMTASVPDSRGRQGSIHVFQSIQVRSSTLSLDFLKYVVRELCDQFEQHEIDEWLRYDGELIKDPHQ